MARRSACSPRTCPATAMCATPGSCMAACPMSRGWPNARDRSMLPMPVGVAALCDELERRVRAAPQMFSRAAVVLDLSHLLDLPDDGAVDAMLEAVRSAG